MSEQWALILNQYTHLIVFAGLWLDSLLAVFPGESLLIGASFYSAIKARPIWDIYILGTLGAWLGSYTSYVIGARVGHSKYLCRLGITPLRLCRIGKLMDKYGLWVLILARFIPGSRQVVYYLAGLGRMPGWKFHLSTVLGILAWAGLAVYVGLIANNNWEKVYRHYGLTIGAVGLGAFAVYLLWLKFFRRAPQSEGD